MPFSTSPGISRLKLLLGAPLLAALAILGGCRAPDALPPAPPTRYFGTLQGDPARTAAQVVMGINVEVVGVNWMRLEPKPGEIDAAYVEKVRDQIRRFREAGALVCLDFALQYTPAWVFEIPHSRFMNQHGQEYRDGDPGRDFPNGIFNRRVREAQARHAANALRLFGDDCYAVRMGWCEYGELGFPRARFDGQRNCFWAYDAVAQGQSPELLPEGLPPCPAPGWKPGAASPDHRDARAFADWYLDALVDYQNWQIGVVRRHFKGPLQMMYPSWGLRPGIVEDLVARDLESDTQEIQRGLDYARLIRALPDPDVIVYCTWMDGDNPELEDDGTDPAKWSPMRYLAHLAHTHEPRLEAWGENSANPSDRRAMARCFERMRRDDIQGLVWAFERNLYDTTGKYASIDHYARFIRELDSPMPTLAEPSATRIADEAEALLRDELGRFFPACVDTRRGGFKPVFKHDWTPGETTTRHIVAQTRLAWTAAEVARRRPDLRETFAPPALHGVRYLRDTMWDREHGGFHWCLDADGALSENLGDEKHAYGVAFGIYAAANVHRATQDPDALALAVEAFAWLDRHAHDAVNGGYAEALRRDGTPITAAPSEDQPGDRMGTPYGQRSMNTQIHILEAFTELYRVWPDARLRERLEEMFTIVRDRIVQQPGTLSMSLEANWRPLPGPASYGHDVEAAYLLLEAAEALGRSADPATLRVARQLVDHALDEGFDWELGGFYDEGPFDGKGLNTRKVWWAQAEGANALARLHALEGRPDSRYLQALRRTWLFIQRHQIDPVHGGWIVAVTREGRPLAGAVVGANKGADSKVTYHTGRAMLNLADTLRRRASPAAETHSN